MNLGESRSRSTSDQEEGRAPAGGVELADEMKGTGVALRSKEDLQAASELGIAFTILKAKDLP